MRVIGGLAKRRTLKAPPGRSIRPTAERVKEALFNILAAKIPGARFLDLFAGTGSVGIEALSRGAVQVVFVERSPRALNLIRENLRRTGFSNRALVLAKDALLALNLLQRRGETFDVIYIDPPYGKGYELKALSLIGSSGLLGRGGLVITETDCRDELPGEVQNLKLFRGERYGDTALSFYCAKESKML
ncbi:MAG: 16S rRNA (guanine(966)-N(2))-methyltransferase RsmD [Firmicutes bacterium]|nr:16S rRNA (guanine(966)-N(2))-methyltransferase RsmD [Bacillota bacterium]